MPHGSEGVTQGEPISRLIEELRAGEASARWRAAKALGRLGGEAAPATTALIEAMGDRSILLRVAAAEALSAMGPAARQAIPALTQGLKDQYASVREVAAEALGNFGPEAREAARPLCALLKDENPYVRAQADGALGRIGSAAVPALIDALADSDPSVRSAAAAILGRMGGVALAALPRLRRLADDADPSVREAAGAARARLDRGAAAPDLEPDDAPPPAPPAESRREPAPRPGPRPDRPPSPPARADWPALGDADDPDRAEPLPWRLPKTLQLGRLRAGAVHERVLRLYVPLASRLSCDVPGMSVEPEVLPAGAGEVVLRLAAPEEEVQFKGRLWLSSASSRQWVGLRGQVSLSPASQAPGRSILWEPLDWDELRHPPRPPGRGSGVDPAARQSPEPAAGATYPGPRRGWDEDDGSALEELEDGVDAWDVRNGTPGRASRPPAVIRGGPLEVARPIRMTVVTPPRPVEVRRGGYRARRSAAAVAAVALLGLPVAYVFRDRLVGPQTPRSAADSRPPAGSEPGRAPAPPAPAGTGPIATQNAEQPPPQAKAQVPGPKTMALNTVSNSVGMTLALLPAGSFQMGATDSDEPSDRPQHRVRITRPFYLGVNEVTQDEWAEVMPDRPNPSWFSPSATGSGREKVAGKQTGRHPVEIVSWFDAVRFCNRLSEKEHLKPYYRIDGEEVSIPEPAGDGYRLPTEAEWEYACRSGSTTPWFFGAALADLPEFAWFSRNSGEQTHSAAEKKPNAFGLYDMYGNVAEWCWDWDGPYGPDPQVDPTGPPGGRYRALRGGAWTSYEADIGSARRFALQPAEHHKDTGFRVARTAPEPAS